MLGGLGAAIVSITDNHPLTQTTAAHASTTDNFQLHTANASERLTDGRTEGRSNSSWGTTDKTADWKRSGGGDNEGGRDGRTEGRRPGRAGQPVLPWHRRAVDGARARRGGGQGRNQSGR